MHSKKYTAKIQEDWSPEDGYYHFITLPDELLKELGWSEGTEVNLKVELAEYNNVLVISKVKK